MRRATWLCLALLLCAAPGCRRHPPSAAGTSGASSAAAEVALQELSVDEVSRRIATHDRIALFDANNRARYERGHVPGARWVRSNEVAVADLPSDRSTLLVFYCANER